MAVNDAYVFPGFLIPVLTQLFLPKPQTTFLTCFCRDERRKLTEKKSCLNWGSNSQPPGHESDTLTIEPPGRSKFYMGLYMENLPNLPVPSHKSLAYQILYVSSRLLPRVPKLWPHPRGHKFYLDLYRENFRNLPAPSHKA